jgi:hypothetical protein
MNCTSGYYGHEEVSCFTVSFDKVIFSLLL